MVETLATFDYVIVGAGSAGCVLADYLTRSGRHSVAIIEAGGSDRKLFVQMPLGYGKTFFDRSINWNYRTEPDPGLNGQQDFWPRGKILGGSGSINAMVWIRGDARDFDDWASEGNSGWSYRDVLPVFKDLEDNEAGADTWRGKGGPLHITDQSRRCHPLANRFVAAGVQAGFRHNRDFNGESQEGVGIYQINTKRGLRHSAARAFLRPALKRKNLTLFSEVLATRLVFEGRRVTGIEVERAGIRQFIRARGEVILAAGAVNSPQLLQLSGIGPYAHLASVGIEPRLDSPAVGHHLQDHLGINYVFRARTPTLNQTLGPWWGKARAGIEYLLGGSGPLSLSLNQGGGFVKTRPEAERPNIQLYFQAISTHEAKKGTRPLLYPDPYPGFAIGLSSCRPKARGSILIRSSDPCDAPAIRPNAYGGEGDLEDMLDGVKLIRRIVSQPALSEITDEELAPGKAIVSDEQLIDDFRSRSGTVYHACGTARMGKDPRQSVVDDRLRVHGFSGLRVADASVFPSVVSGNTNAPTMMVAAKASTMILEEADGR
ncbi:GMC family oxidoreductase [Rhizobium alvei]|uniref:GMC family oxidoreductase N-terminal domain-containing protein n=1 Tax=Rhizobium alvei TaxID=1132659 RepID=A0ABT8YSA9_9HYPH|nr:GMC family oxidoreductase N-terminal domain-containing protein [Rhizobium alvei]MDO6966539.1 GMC family oxidoreductase N-terminal domain-containing protein [Rhizobium alvei]